jgi:hypothetical protein
MWKITRWTAKMATSSCKAATRGMPAAHGVASSVRPRTNGPRLAPVEKVRCGTLNHFEIVGTLNHFEIVPSTLPRLLRHVRCLSRILATMYSQRCGRHLFVRAPTPRYLAVGHITLISLHD